MNDRVRERYQNDLRFHAAVDSTRALLEQGLLTTTDFMYAATLACQMYAEENDAKVTVILVDKASGRGRRRGPPPAPPKPAPEPPPIPTELGLEALRSIGVDPSPAAASPDAYYAARMAALVPQWRAAATFHREQGGELNEAKAFVFTTCADELEQRSEP